MGCDCDVKGGVDDWTLPADDEGAEWNDVGEADGIGESTVHAVGAKNVDGDDDGEVEDHGMGECADGTVADADDGDEEADAMGECGNVTVADVVCETDGMECDLVFLVDFLVLLLQVVAGQCSDIWISVTL